LGLEEAEMLSRFPGYRKNRTGAPVLTQGENMAQTVLITGCSSGFGELATNTLLEAGHTVVATMRDPDGRNRPAADRLREAANELPGTVYVLELDVTDEGSVASAVRQAEELTGGVDVVVNNAGFGGGGHMEAFTAEQFHQMFDVNLYGVQRVSRAALPGMRKRGKGLILNVSSCLGRVILPFTGPYVASKFALEGMSEGYRYELAGTGVEVSILQPGGFGTAFMDRMAMPADEGRVAEYGEFAELPEKMWNGFAEAMSSEDAPDPQLVADAILELVEMPAGTRPPRKTVDPLMGGMGVPELNAMTAEAQKQLLSHAGMDHMAEVT
jgi:NAD(P)-dependent dehydrogenase (short-subunit alcohol dehydrogenase family)